MKKKDDILKSEKLLTKLISKNEAEIEKTVT